MTASGTYESDHLRELTAAIQNIDARPCEQQSRYAMAAEVLTMIIDDVDSIAHLKPGRRNMKLGQIRRQVAGVIGSVGLVRVGGNTCDELAHKKLSTSVL